MRRISLLISALALASCTFAPEGPGFTAPARDADLDPYGYDARDVSRIGKFSVHGAAEVRFTWKFTWPWDHPETWRRPDMPNYPTEHPYPWND